MRLSSTVMDIWRPKDNGVTSLIFWGHVTSSVTWPFDFRGSTFYGWSIGTNLIHDFTAVTFSVKLAFFREKRRFPWNSWFFVNF